ncbi:protein kinase, partial [Marasmius sp. AFHP31]
STELWADVYKGIGEWMGRFGMERGETEDWQWGREVYWMAFVAAFPHFPAGSWTNWDPAIELEGPFIVEWVGRGGTASLDRQRGSNSLEQQARDEIWQHFRQAVWTRYSVCL